MLDNASDRGRHRSQHQRLPEGMDAGAGAMSLGLL